MKIILGLIFLSILVVIHELGHFLTALALHIKVNAFSLGMGPILLHKTIKGVDFRLSLFPIGGYCAIKGEDDFKRALEEKLTYIKGTPDSLYGAAPIKRALIAFSGPLFNAIFASLFFMLIALLGYSYSSYSAKIALPPPTAPSIISTAREAGIKDNDVIIKVNDTDIENFSSLISAISPLAGTTASIKVMREGKEFSFFVPVLTDKIDGSGKIGVMADPTSLTQYEVSPLPFHKAFIKGVLDTSEAVVLTIKGILSLFKSKNISDSVAGPARIVSMIGEVTVNTFSVSVRTGLASLLNFLAYISISLFIMNLLPIPILDGSLLLFSLLECVTHKKFSPRFLYYIQFVGLFLILVLFILGMTGDIKYFSSQK